jgi:hypothetical protein
MKKNEKRVLTRKHGKTTLRQMRHAIRTKVVADKPIGHRECDDDYSQVFSIFPEGASREELIQYGRQTALNNDPQEEPQKESANQSR